jgi:hypothetical protein
VTSGVSNTSSALISSDGLYRYTLHRSLVPPTEFWKPVLKPLLFIGINPSTADAARNDNTVRKLLEFAPRWFCTSVTVVNLFAYRTAYPKELWAAQAAGVDIVGPDNDHHIKTLLASHRDGIILAGWGADKKARARAAVVCEMLPVGTQCLELNQDESPKHPLYVRYDEPLKPYIVQIN